MKTIRDAIHGNINLSEREVKILDSAEMQRLRNIKDLGFTYLVYPSATHTRFEHSLGIFYLADKLAGNLGLSKGDTEKLKIAGLLHDIGHGPFSHSSEKAIESDGSYNHEINTKRIIEKSSIADNLKKLGLDPKEIAKIAIGKVKPLGEIIAGEIDLDRMDYLVRDSYYTGAAYGIIDLERLLHVLTVRKDRLVIDEGGLAAAESMVRARYLMYPAVYNHHTTRIVNTMFSRAIVDCLKNKVFNVKELYEMDDIGLISKMRELKGFAGNMIKRIDQRRLYKRALVLDKEDLKSRVNKMLKMKPEKIKSLELEISKKCNLAEGSVLLDIPQPLYSEEAKASVIVKGKVKPLREVSTLVKSLIEGQWIYWNIGVYCAKRNVKKVGKAAKDILIS